MYVGSGLCICVVVSVVGIDIDSVVGSYIVSRYCVVVVVVIVADIANVCVIGVCTMFNVICGLWI